MTTYTTITNALVAVGAKPFATTIQALRDNPIAIAEADATVPAGLLPTVLLGTLTTTSGSTQTLSSLVLTPYRFLIFIWDNVSLAGGVSPVFRVGTATVSATIASPGNTHDGMVTVSLDSGRVFGGVYEVTPSTTGTIYIGASGYSTATTSVSVSTTESTFDLGSVKVYGVK